jgi:hypothetical protein
MTLSLGLAYLPGLQAPASQQQHQGRVVNTSIGRPARVLLVRLISHQDGPTATWALTRALIGGAQPISGWWAPVVQCHIRGGWELRAQDARFTVATIPTLIRSRGRHCQRWEAPRHCFPSSPPIAALAQIFTDEPVINADGMCLVPTLILHLYLSHTHDIYDKHKRNPTDLPLHDPKSSTMVPEQG